MNTNKKKSLFDTDSISNFIAFGESLKEKDRDRYLLSFFAHDQHRTSIRIADRLNYEIARVREVVSQPHIGMIRLQWWRDRIVAVYAGNTETSHEILPHLGCLARDYAVPQEMWFHLIDAREPDHVGEPLTTVDDFARYAQHSHAPLLRIKLKLQEAAVPDEIVNSVARIYAMVGLVRAAPFHAGQGRVYLPVLSVTSVAPHNAKMIEAVKSVCDIVSRDMAMIKTDNRYLKAHLVLTRLYLHHIIKCGYDPFHLTPLPLVELRLWWGVKF